MPRRSLADIQWIIDALEKDGTKSRKGVGDAINIDKTGVSRLLSGNRALKMREGLKIAEYLGVPAPFGFAESAAAFAPAPKSPLAPVYRSTIGGAKAPATFRIFRNERPVDYRPKAAHFASAAEVFGVYVEDDLMSPRFKPGELILVDPSRRIAPGDDVLFIAKRMTPDGERALVGELAAATGAHFEYFQHGRKGVFRLPAKSWTAAPVLKGY